MKRVVVTLVTVLCLVVGGAAAYGVANVRGWVSGPLTTEQATPLPLQTPGAPAAAVALPTGDSSDAPMATLSPTAARPTAAGLARTLTRLVTDPRLGPRAGVAVLDGATGATLFTQAPSQPRRPASTLKILTAAAVLAAFGPADTMTTKVVQTGPGRLALVAGGDTMLAPGAGRPTAVEGHAGLADLAAQVHSALGARAADPVTLRLDLSYAAAPRIPRTWNPQDITDGYTAPITMIGLAGQRPTPRKPTPASPETTAVQAFAARLRALGTPVTVAPASTWQAAAHGATLGSVTSAPIPEVLALALDESEDAITENLARQAAVKKGMAATQAPAYVASTIAALGVDTTGLHLVDTSGLSYGSRVSVTTMAQVVALGTTGKQPALRTVLAGLPIAGLTGTLDPAHQRFDAPDTRGVAGVPRAKTGTLTGISGMVGTTVDADGRLLAFVLMADAVPSGTGTTGARTALDRIVAALTGCGCR